MNELKRLQLAITKANNVVYEWNVNKNIITWTGDTRSILSLDNPIEISTLERFIELIHKQDRAKFISSFELSRDNGGDYSRVYRIVIDDEEFVRVVDKGTVEKVGNDTVMVGMISADDDVVRVRSLKKEPNMREQNYGAYNDNYENDIFIEELHTIYQNCVTADKEAVLLKISIDNLPMMMTWYSPKFANRIMEALEIQLTQLLRESDVIHRTALDQFGIILRNQTKTEVELVIDRILRKIQLYNNPSFKEPIHLRTSIGSVHFPSYTDSPTDALNKAYLALSNAKNKASEFHCDYLDAKREHLDSKDQVTKLLYMQNAFKENKIHLAYQPVIKSSDGHVASYECLMRVEDEHGNLSSAGNLIPVAERMGYIDIVDEYVLEKVVAELKEYPDISLAFNVSNLTTDNPKWLQHCTRILENADIAHRMIVEITETAAQGDLRQTAYFVAALQAIGCQVALDDFGAGYTSFRQLKSLSVDKVKIDGSYIMGLEENSENLLFIKTLLDFNQSYGLETVAECVETGEVAKILMGLKVDYMQGYYFGKPDIARPWAGEKLPYEQEVS